MIDRTSSGTPISEAIAMSNPSGPTLTKRPARPWRLVLGAFLLLVGMANSANVRTAPGDLAGALGALTGVLMLVVAAVWLIGSGLPKAIGNRNFTRLRRRIWFKLAGLGLLVMIVLAIGLAALSQFAAGVLVTWMYWFGWTWISWRIADKQAQRRFQESVLSTPATSPNSQTSGSV